MWIITLEGGWILLSVYLLRSKLGTKFIKSQTLRYCICNYHCSKTGEMQMRRMFPQIPWFRQRWDNKKIDSNTIYIERLLPSHQIMLLDTDGLCTRVPLNKTSRINFVAMYRVHIVPLSSLKMTLQTWSPFRRQYLLWKPVKNCRWRLVSYKLRVFWQMHFSALSLIGIVVNWTKNLLPIRWSILINCFRMFLVVVPVGFRKFRLFVFFHGCPTLCAFSIRFSSLFTTIIILWWVRFSRLKVLKSNLLVLHRIESFIALGDR